MQATTYAAPRQEVVVAVQDVVEHLYGIAASDGRGSFVTRSFWIKERGMHAGRYEPTEDVRGGYVVRVQDVGSSGHVVVVITPTLQRRRDADWTDVSPFPVEYRRRFNTGLSKLAIAIHDRLAAYAVR